MTLWSGRFDTAPDPAAFEFGISFGFDRLLFEDDVMGSLAWAEALAQSGELDQAIDVLRDGIRRDGQSADLHFTLGILLQHTGQTAEGEAMIRKAQQLGLGQ